MAGGLIGHHRRPFAPALPIDADAVSQPPVLFDSHMHTPLCRHAVGEPEEYAARAFEVGLKGIIVTCHNPDPDGWSPKVRMAVEEFGTYCEIVERAREAWAGKIEVLLGLESDYAPGLELWLERLHQMAPLQFVLGSVHSHLPQYRERYFRGSPRAFQLTYFEHLAMAAETGLYDCISHPDLVKNDFPRDWDLEAIFDGVRRALDRIARTGVAMELNTSGLLKVVAEMNPGPRILREIATRRIPIVLGSDSHKPQRVGADFGDALDQLAAAGFEEVHHFVERQKRSVPIRQARDSLREPIEEI
jgi:histidinol-phosphatase (PHP family)